MPRRQRSKGDSRKAPVYTSFRGDSSSSDKDTISASQQVAQTLKRHYDKKGKISHLQKASKLHTALEINVQWRQPAPLYSTTLLLMGTLHDLSILRIEGTQRVMRLTTWLG